MTKRIITLLLLLLPITMMAQPPHHHEAKHEHGRGHMPPPVLCATPEQLSMTLQVLGQQSFDDKKLDIAKLAVTLGHFCADDMAQMAKLFSYDDSRLAFLLYAHDFCQDPQFFPAVRDVFTFQLNYEKLCNTLYPPKR